MVKIDARYALAFIDRGSTLAAQGQADRAIQDFDEAIKLDPGSAAAYNRGKIYQGKGDYDRAIQDFDRAIALNSEICRGLL